MCSQIENLKTPQKPSKTLKKPNKTRWVVLFWIKNVFLNPANNSVYTPTSSNLNPFAVQPHFIHAELTAQNVSLPTF